MKPVIRAHAGRTRRAVARRIAVAMAVGGLAAVLLWGKLRLVSNMPRSVYAEPKASSHAGDPSPRR
ncbi:MAG: hypothetical protein KF787_00715 [Phycisphaeraceae bacterium]|nr:hypothetical protein [Phycisphaerae bacterium]MBX3391144.1 hypothetical protein [Phycisphaeraceae bacterium]HRJ50389.1 hypothetical protein [Phycisphaerales bacterium]